jgi:hypothetical protein
MKKWVALAAVSVVGTVVLWPLTWTQRTVLERADEFTLLSLNSYEMGMQARIVGAKFHNHRTLGGVKITDDKLKARLVAALFRAIDESRGFAAACFKPRHGIRARRGWRTIDAVICFECGHVHFHEWGRRNSFNVSFRSGAPFDAVLRAARVRVAAPASE